MQVLIVVDMQKDFIDGALGTAEAVAIVPSVVQKLKGFTGKVFLTRDTHGADYLNTAEGKKLPVPHCIRGSEGWALHPAVAQAAGSADVLDKPTFGSVELGERLRALDAESPITRIELVGLCTDICVISNALLCKAFVPHAEVCVDAACCAGVTLESHSRALETMRACQIEIL